MCTVQVLPTIAGGVPQGGKALLHTHSACSDTTFPAHSLSLSNVFTL